MAYPTDPIVLIGIWTTTILTMFMYSFVLFKESAIFRITEYTFVASSIGLLIVTMVRVIVTNLLSPIAGGNYILIITLILGILMYFRLSPKYVWISRWPFSVVVGVFLGLGIRRQLTTTVVANVKGTIEGMASAFVSGDPILIFNNIIVVIGIVCLLMYFTFTREHTGFLKIPAQVGRWFLLILFATYFGSMAFGRYTLLLDRINDILRVLGLIPY